MLQLELFAEPLARNFGVGIVKWFKRLRVEDIMKEDGEPNGMSRILGKHIQKRDDHYIARYKGLRKIL